MRTHFTHDCNASWSLDGDVPEALCPNCNVMVIRRPRRMPRVGALCRVLKHDWVEAPLQYRQGTTTAYSESHPEGFEASVTWTCDEVCSRCGAETWVPW